MVKNQKKESDDDRVDGLNEIIPPDDTQKKTWVGKLYFLQETKIFYFKNKTEREAQRLLFKIQKSEPEFCEGPRKGMGPWSLTELEFYEE